MRNTRSTAARFVVFVLAVALLWFVLRGMDWQAVGDVLKQLTPVQLILLLLVNALIVLLFGARWWLILRAQGYRLPLLRVSAYRLAGFGVSYFTPGPQFGGEPLQVILLVRRENVPSTAAAASVVLDKLLELASNFAFLAFGVAVLAGGELLDARTGPIGMAIAIGMLLLPLGYLILLSKGNKPLGRLVQQISNSVRRLEPAAEWMFSAEAEAAAFVKKHRVVFLLAVLLSGVVWAALVLEYLLAIRFLGFQLTFLQVVSVMTAARLAVLLPMPGGLGTLEAALVLVSQALGQGTAPGVSLSLLIRARDVLFAAAGLWLGRRIGYSNSLTE